MPGRSTAPLIALVLALGVALAPGRATAQAVTAPPASPPASSPTTPLPLAPASPSPNAEESLRRAWDLKAEALKALQDGRAREGLPKAREAVALREAALGPDHADVGDALDLLGRLLERTGDLRGARETFARALAIREAAGGPESADAAETAAALAGVLQQLAEYRAARPLYERAIRIQESLLGPESAEVADTLREFAVLQLDTGDLTGGRATVERVLNIREKVLGPNHARTALSMVDLGRVFRDQGEYDRARALLQKGLAIQEKALGPEHPAVGYTLLNLAVLYQRLDDLPQSKKLWERALAIREKAFGPEHPAVAFTLTNTALVLRLMQDLQGAQPLLDRALRIQERTFGPDHPAVAETLRARALVAQGLRNHTLARADLERALRIDETKLGPNHPRTALVLTNLGWTFWQTRDYSAAQRAYQRAVTILRGGGMPEVYWRSAWMLGRTHERNGKQLEAAAAYREATTVIRGLAASLESQQSRAQYLEGANRLAVFDALARVLLRLHERDQAKGYDLEAMAALEAKKALIVASALGATPLAIQDPEARRAAGEVGNKKSATARLERQLEAEQAKAPGDQQADRIRDLTRELARTKGEYLAQVQAFLTRYPRYRAQFVEQQTVDPKAIAKLAERLPAGTLAVQYFAAPDTLYLFVVAAGGQFQVKTQAVSQKDLYDLVRAYRGGLERAAQARLPWSDDGSEAYRRDVAPLREVARKLADHLLVPIEAELAQHPNLVLLPNDLLLYLPIHALPRKAPDGTERFLAETHAVSYVTQLELVDLLTASHVTPDAAILALANPDGTLPAASREVRELSRLHPGVTVLEGADATKARFFELAGKFPELHLATHGVLDPERPEQSFLLLAGTDEASQRLTIGEIAGLSLSPDTLAILSGCETALGEQVPGAALVTMAAAFSQAGSRSIVASLWKVSDAATRDFMVAFHRNLGARGPAAALQQAEQALIGNARTAHPFYWAPFVLLGAR